MRTRPALSVAAAEPLSDYLACKDEIDAAIARVLRVGRYILGDEVGRFEEEFAEYCGVRFGIGVGSGTDALRIALLACGVGPGDEVVTVSMTAVATVAAIEMCGAEPVLVDLDRYGTLDAARLDAAITARTRAVVPVHLYGQPADLPAILGVARERRLHVVEDCAQAHGARLGGRSVGSFGVAAAFSFYPTKNLGAFGDGGMVLTSDPEIARRARLLREYGWTKRYISEIPGWNSRLDEIQAAVLGVKLRRLDEGNASRRRIADLYDSLLDGVAVSCPARRPNAEHVFHQYVLRSSARDELREALASRGIGTLVHYPQCVHEQPAYRGRVRLAGSMDGSERLAREVLSLPIRPLLSASDARAVAEAVRYCA